MLVWWICDHITTTSLLGLGCCCWLKQLSCISLLVSPWLVSACGSYIINRMGMQRAITFTLFLSIYVMQSFLRATLQRLTMWPFHDHMDYLNSVSTSLHKAKAVLLTSDSFFGRNLHSCRHLSNPPVADATQRTQSNHWQSQPINCFFSFFLFSCGILLSSFVPHHHTLVSDKTICQWDWFLIMLLWYCYSFSFSLCALEVAPTLSPLLSMQIEEVNSNISHYHLRLLMRVS